MGDSGAYFFGFVLAATSILGNLKVTTVVSLFPTVLFLFLPLLDTVVVIVRRLLKRTNPISTPGTDHLHHRLLAFGFTPTGTTLVLWAITLAANIVAMAVQGLSALVIVVTTVVIVTFLALVAWRRRVAHRRAVKRERRQQARQSQTDQGPPISP
jgi:UDP-GlcNAc:undecaprenyl-phosphate GlcNAc-1-phosphate transferase